MAGPTINQGVLKSKKVGVSNEHKAESIFQIVNSKIKSKSCLTTTHDDQMKDLMQKTEKRKHKSGDGGTVPLSRTSRIG